MHHFLLPQAAQEDSAGSYEENGFRQNLTENRFSVITFSRIMGDFYRYTGTHTPLFMVVIYGRQPFHGSL